MVDVTGLRQGAIRRMVAALTVSQAEETYATVETDLATFGVCRRWVFQQVLERPRLLVALDADVVKSDGVGAARGPRVPSSDIAEAVASLYVARGLQFVQALEGAFSVALWDKDTGRLVLAVDRFGVRLLYWRMEGDRILFGSRLGAVRAVQRGACEIDAPALGSYFVAHGVAAPLSVFRGTHKLAPGLILVFKNGRVREQCYWDLEYPESADRRLRSWTRRVREEVRAAVNRKLAGVPPETIGSYLSGGIDSSSIVAFMRDRCSRPNTFSIVFGERDFSEAPYIRQVARRFNTNHHEHCLGPECAFPAVERLAAYYEEPFSNSSAIAAFSCAMLARESGVEVLLAGDGGDELFAGNNHYSRDRCFQNYYRLPEGVRTNLLEPLVDLLPAQRRWYTLPRRYVRRARLPNPLRVFSYNPIVENPPEEVFEPDFLAAAPAETWFTIARGHYQCARTASELNRLLYVDFKVTLADNDLRKVMGTAELAGVNVRFPFLDRRLAELAGRIPANLKLKGFRLRHVYKLAMKGLLPEEVLSRAKHGFGVPIGCWLQRDRQWSTLVGDLLADRCTRWRGIFRVSFIDHLLRNLREGSVGYEGQHLWRVMSLELWFRCHYDSWTPIAG
jgi:asparagine synthase (glutamine-hydrolysing)